LQVRYGDRIQIHGTAKKERYTDSAGATQYVSSFMIKGLWKVERSTIPSSIGAPPPHHQACIHHSMRTPCRPSKCCLWKRGQRRRVFCMQYPLRACADVCTQEELWQELQERPENFWDNRASKLNPKAPDWKHKDSGDGLWESSQAAAPSGAHAAQPYAPPQQQAQPQPFPMAQHARPYGAPLHLRASAGLVRTPRMHAEQGR
jgi:hypothetical protein